VRDSVYINCTTKEKVDCIFEFAEKYNLNIDIHVDESDYPDIECFKYVIRKTKDKKWNGNVTCGHVTALSAIGFPDDEANKAIIDSVQANINIITLSSCNLYLMSSNRRGVTRVREFLKAGSNISFASDNVRDPFRPFGNANMLEEALITAQINKFGMRLHAQLNLVFMIFYY
jgi:cytosine deaminase